jgi:hypothetical protein
MPAGRETRSRGIPDGDPLVDVSDHSRLTFSFHQGNTMALISLRQLLDHAAEHHYDT